MKLTFTPSVAPNDNTWTLSINAPEAVTPGLGTIPILFSPDGGSAHPNGTLEEFGVATGTFTGSAGG
ncbi:MAG: hypothetical protein ACK53L_10500, partial [Pirellulaceae bacterium]